MRVLINCLAVTRDKAGVGVYVLNLVRELGKTNDHVQLFILVHDDDHDFDFPETVVTTIRVSPAFARNVAVRVLLEQIYIPWLIRRHRIDVVHGPVYTFPVASSTAKVVVTVHDMTSYLLPDFHTFARRHFHRFFIKRAATHADSIIFVSNCTRTDFVDYFKIERESLFVVPHGVGPEFTPDQAPGATERVIQKYGVTRPFLLYVGVIEPRKNLTRLVEAFAQITKTRPGLTLVIAGKRGWKYEDLFVTIRRLGIEQKVIFTGFVEEADKPCLIASATAVAYPSLYEGFGIPVLEAMACAVPTLTSNVSSLPEIVGDGALLIDPLEPMNIASGLERLLTDRLLRQRLEVQGRQQAAQYTWRRTAEETRRVYVITEQGRSCE